MPSQDAAKELVILKLVGDYRGEGKINGHAFSAQKFYGGKTIKQMLKSDDIKCSLQFNTLRQTSYDLIASLHSKNISHGDIHGSNLLFTLNSTRFNVRAIDYGNSILKKDTTYFGFLLTKAWDYLGVDLTILKAQILFYQKHKVSLFWLNRRDFCIK